jgi:hypothetical protein
MTGGDNQVAYDSVPDKLARETGVLASGVTKGLFAAVENIYQHPGQTALQVATGVAVTALFSRSSLLKLPALAIAAYGGGELLVSAKEVVSQALPAVAEIWSNPDVSKKTTSLLESQVRDTTAAATLGAASFFLAGKGLAALESSAPNNSLGRLVFGHEPVSLKYPRHIVRSVDGKLPELQLLPFTPGEQTRLITAQTKDVTYSAFARGPFLSIEDAKEIGARPFVERSRVYSIAGAKNEVVIPEWLDKRFDSVRQLERSLTFPQSLLNLGKLDAIKAQIAAHPMTKLAKPEDVLTSLALLPDADYVGQVTISPYLLKIFKKNLLPPFRIPELPPVASRPARGMARLSEGETYLKYDRQKPVGSGNEPLRTLRHEWAHHAEFRSQEYKTAFRSGAVLERDGFYKRKYATQRSENQAVHLGEGILATSNKDFENTARKAPIRTAVMAARLKQILATVPEENRGLFHQHYTDRVQWLEKIIVPRATRILSEIDKSNAPGKKDAIKVLKYLGADRGAIVRRDPNAQLGA